MCNKVVCLAFLILVLNVASSVHAALEAFSLPPAHDAHVGNDAQLEPGENDGSRSSMYFRDIEPRRRVSFVSYDILEFQSKNSFFSNVYFSNYGHESGTVLVYGVIEGLDEIDETTITWNNAPGVKNDPAPTMGDPVALDSVACKIIDLKPEFVPTSEPGERAGLGTYHYENIEIIGEDVESLVDKDFEVIRKPPVSASSGRLRTFIKNRICPRPTIDKTICTNCGTCVEMCPINPKAVNWHTGDESRQPRFKYGRCIRCYCCQETCPDGAIFIDSPLLGRFFPRI